MRTRELARQSAVEVPRGVPRTEYQPRSGVVFRCEACRREVHDLRAVSLVHRAEGWRIECPSHDDGEFSVDGGRLFGGGLHALEIYGDLAGARWFDPAELFRALLRLRAQASGLYVAPRDERRPCREAAAGHRARPA